MNKTVQVLEYDVGRKDYKDIGNWAEFMQCWNEARTKQQAIGLLHSGVNVPPFDVPKSVVAGAFGGTELKMRVNFYLQVVERSNDAIAEVARQLIVSKWLRRVDVYLLYEYRDDIAETMLSLLRFLQYPSHELYGAPYPRFVSEWLESIWEIWMQSDKFPHSPKVQAITRFMRSRKMVGLDQLLIKAMCTWGMAYLLARDDCSKPWSSRYIQEYLADERYEPSQAVAAISGAGDHLSQLTHAGDKNDPRVIASLALMKLFYCAGGFTVKFDKKGEGSVQKLKT